MEKLFEDIINIEVKQYIIYSDYLEREVTIDAYIPSNLPEASQTSLLIINDGQDLPTMPFTDILENLYNNHSIQPLLCVGIYCGEERRREYGIGYSPDYKVHGDKAGLYSKFIFDEFMPFIRKKFHAPSFKEKSFAGFSLGGLSALDIVWNHATEFTRIGMFSGSLWWRRKAYEEGYDDENDRLMHLQIRKGQIYPWLRFFFECGKLDEEEDRNNNGVIDSIDDTLDLIVELKSKGYNDNHICYVELPEGKHDVNTWKEAFPEFLKWGWGKKSFD